MVMAIVVDTAEQNNTEQDRSWKFEKSKFNLSNNYRIKSKKMRITVFSVDIYLLTYGRVEKYVHTQRRAKVDHKKIKKLGCTALLYLKDKTEDKKDFL